jgi:hypothetical protein
MKTSQVRAATVIGSLAALLSACGGNVSLGGKGSQANGAAGAASTPDEAQAPAGERVLKRSDLIVNELMVAGDYLYLVGSAPPDYGIFRCRKSDCQATFEPFVIGNVAYPQAFGDRLAFTRWEYGSFGFASVAFANPKDEQLVIGGLPYFSAVPPLFYDDFVFFALADDRSLYRCSLPACADNPERLLGTKGRVNFTPRADADQLIWSEGPFIYRAGGYGTEPAIALQLDDSLSEAPAAVLSSDEPSADRVSALDVGNGMLYASIARSPDGQPCDHDCPHEVMSWPVLGGASRRLFNSNGRVQNLRIFDDELVWTSPSAVQVDYDDETVSTCRIEACEATRRDLGAKSRVSHSVVSADEDDIYWIEAELTTTTTSAELGFRPNQIRRAPRLPAP